VSCEPVRARVDKRLGILRAAARSLPAGGVAPDRVDWSGGAGALLLPLIAAAAPEPDVAAVRMRVPRRLLELGECGIEAFWLSYHCSGGVPRRRNFGSRCPWRARQRGRRRAPPIPPLQCRPASTLSDAPVACGSAREDGTPRRLRRPVPSVPILRPPVPTLLPARTA
jgi:hypothetical protein